MATFNAFLDTLPNPTVKIGQAGQALAEGDPGQGFATVTVSRNLKIDADRTIGGKYVRRRNSYPMWDLRVRYNELTKEQFDPIYSFIMEKQVGLRPFFIELPQYGEPKNSAFVDYLKQPNTLTVTSAALAGRTSMEISNTGVDTTIPYFGDLFHIEDPNDSFHTKAYMIDRVETTSVNVTPPTVGSLRIHFSPALHRNVAFGSDVVFLAPKMLVRQKQKVQEYRLTNDGLYNFELQLEEISY